MSRQAATSQITVRFGSKSTRELEDGVASMYNSLGEEDQQQFAFIRSPKTNAVITVSVDDIVHLRDEEALRFLDGFHALSTGVPDDGVTSQQELPEPYNPSTDDHLAKVLIPPAVQYSDAAPTTGFNYQFDAHRYLPMEKVGMYHRHDEAAPTSRYTMSSLARMAPDGRTRLPSMM